MSWIVVDWEADGPYPPKYSGVCFGAVIVKDGLKDTFYGKIKPISDIWVPEALAVSGISREEHLKFEDPSVVMKRFRDWIKEKSVGRTIFASDNLAFDWMFNHYYLLEYAGEDPFGFSGRRIGDIWSGMKRDVKSPWKNILRKTKHDHNPVNDAKGNAEALLTMRDMGLRVKFE